MTAEILKNANIAETELIGALLLAPSLVMAKVRDIVSPNDFAFELCKAVYLSASQLIDEGESENLDVSTIQLRTKRNGVEIDNQWAMEAMQIAPPTSKIEVVAKAVKDFSVERQAQDLGLLLADGSITANEAKDKLERIIGRKANGIVDPMIDATNFLHYFAEVMSGKKSSFTSTGFKRLDDVLGGGFIESGLITLAARPAAGKTAVALALADNIAKQGKKILYESLEMSSNQLWARRVSRESGVSSTKIMRGDLKGAGEDAKSKVINTITKLSERQFYVQDKAASVAKIEADMSAIDNLGLVVIDHIGLLKPENAHVSRYEATTNATHRLKQIAVSTGIPILALCQINRNGVGTASTPPTMANLRDSGSVEEDSDVVMLLHRPDYYNPKDDQVKPWEAQDLNIVVDKNRHGMTGKVDMSIVLSTMRIWEKT